MKWFTISTSRHDTNKVVCGTHPLGGMPTNVSDGHFLVKNPLVCCGFEFQCRCLVFGFCRVGVGC